MADPNENSLERILNQLADLFKMVESNQNKPLGDRITPEIKEKLDRVKEFVEKYTELNAKVLESGGIQENDLTKIIKNPEGLPPKRKKLIDFSKKLKDEVERAKMALLLQTESEGFHKDKKQTADDIAKRKKKFKRLGGKNWL